VGVYEPPLETGRVTVPQPVVGRRVIRDLDRVQRLAVSWIDQHGLARRDGMELLAQAPPLEPMLVSVTGRRNRPYYLVPFGMDRGEIQAAVILNAYTGELEESIVLPSDCFFKYSTLAQAQQLAVEELGVPQEWLNPPRLTFRQTAETPDRFFPVWQVGLRRDVFITPSAESVHRLAVTEEEYWDRRGRKGPEA